LYKIQTNSISKKVEDLITKRKYVSIPIKNFLNKDIAGKIFDITRPIEKKNW